MALKAVEFNAGVAKESVIRDLLADLHPDVVIPFDCADPQVTFEVRGFFVVPDGACWKSTADLGA